MFHSEGPSVLELTTQWLSSTQRGYDLLAPKFDYTPFRTPDSLLSLVREHIQRSTPAHSLLDVCCGTGAAIQVLEGLYDHAVGIDFSRGMLDVAGKGVEKRAVDFVLGNALSLPFKRSFDMVVSFGAFGHILAQEQPRMISEIAQALKPGGRFMFITTEMPSLWSWSYWLSRGVNAAMHARNWVLKTKFNMYYLTFLLPEASNLLEDFGFNVQVHRPFPKPFERLRLVVATLESS